jgi:hypothetical protein
MPQIRVDERRHIGGRRGRAVVGDRVVQVRVVVERRVGRKERTDLLVLASSRRRDPEVRLNAFQAARGDILGP